MGGASQSLTYDRCVLVYSVVMLGIEPRALCILPFPSFLTFSSFHSSSSHHHHLFVELGSNQSLAHAGKDRTNEQHPHPET